MRELPLTQGRVSIVDDADYEVQIQFRWCVSTIGKHQYAKRRCRERRKIVYLHREIMGNPAGMVVDHVNGNTLDNRRENLRATDKKGNAANRPPDRNNTSGFKGVAWSKQAGKWLGRICVDGQTRHLGTFSSAVDAARAYNEAAIAAFGEFAHLNPIPEAA